MKFFSKWYFKKSFSQKSLKTKANLLKLWGKHFLRRTGIRKRSLISKAEFVLPANNGDKTNSCVADVCFYAILKD